MKITAAKLNPKQKKLIRKLVSLQLESLNNILTEDIEGDLTMFCIENSLNKEALKNLIKERKYQFYRVYNEPGTIFALDEENQTIIKTILVNIAKGGFKTVQKEIWLKFNLVDNLEKSFSQN